MQRSIVISAQNDATTIAQAVAQAMAARADEVVVVVGGSTDGTPEVARAAGAKVHQGPSPLGHDVAKAIGAKLAQGQTVVFLSADIVVPVRDLSPFFYAVENGVDVALNDLNWRHRTVPAYDWISLSKGVLNRLAGRQDLGLASLTTVPYALSHTALEELLPYLAVPPLAQVIAILRGLQVRPVHTVDIAPKQPRPGAIGAGLAPAENLILGDYLEGLGLLLQSRGPRGAFTDLARRREIVQEVLSTPVPPPMPPPPPPTHRPTRVPVGTARKKIGPKVTWDRWALWKTDGQEQ